MSKHKKTSKTDDDLLKEYRYMLKHPETDYKTICTDISNKSKTLRINNIKSNMINIIESNNMLHKYSSIPGHKLKMITPGMVTSLSEIIKLLDEFRKLEDRNVNKENVKLKNIIDKINSKILVFTEAINKSHTDLECVLNGLILNYENMISFNNVLDMAYNNKLLMFDELNILKTFNHIRNLFAHNKSIAVLLSLTREEILLYKAVMLEVRTLFAELVLKYEDRLLILNLLMGDLIKKHMDNPTTIKEYTELINDNLEYESKHGIKLSIKTILPKEDHKFIGVKK